MIRRAAAFFLLSGALLLARPALRAAPDHPVIPGFERFYTADKADLAKGGRLLLAELNCVSCHATTDKALARKPAPVLSDVASRVRLGHIRQFLADPHKTKPGTTMPDVLAADAAERKAQVEALVHFLASTGSLRHERPQLKSIPNGRNLYRQVGCVACHGARDDRGLQETITRATVPLGDLKAKYSIPSLAAFLEQPLHARPGGRMPRLLNNAQEARSVATFLLQGLNVQLAAGKGASQYAYYEGGWDKLPDFSNLKPKRTGTAPGFELSVSPRESNYALTFDAVWRAPRDGDYTFTLASDDGARLLLDGKPLLDTDGIHPVVTKSAKVKLTRRTHKVRVEYFQGGGEAVLGVTVRGPGLKGNADLGELIAVDEKALDARPVVKQPNGDEVEVKPELAKKGRELFASLGCASCHEMKTGGQAVASSLTAPALDRLAGKGGCLDGKGDKASPRYPLGAKQTEALRKALSSKPPAAPDAIAATMTALNCYACHSRDKVGGVEDDLNKFILTTQPEMGDEGRLPPPLDGVGAKLLPEMLRTTLEQGAKHRPYMHTRMPAFGPNAAHLPAAFEAADRLPAIEAVKFKETDARVKARARHLVGGLALGCIKCHTWNGQKAEGVQGIDLTLMPRRLRRDWFHAYIEDPQKVRPGTRMPASFQEGKSVLPDVLDGTARAQIEAMWLYLRDGGSAQPPIGLGPRSIPLVPKDTAILYRNFIAGAGPRGIAVGYPERANLAFDANEMRLALLWHNAFIDAAKHWTDRGVGFQGPLGDNVLRLHPGAPVAVLAKADAPWPAADARKLGWRFKGYKLTKDDRPTFLYAQGDLAVEDFPNPVAVGKDRDAHVRRALTLKAAKPIDNLHFRAAVGDKVEALKDGWYKVDGWRLKVTADSKPLIRVSGGKSELLVPIKFADLQAKVVVEYSW